MSRYAGQTKQATFNHFGLVQLPELHHGTTFPYKLPIIGTELSKAFPGYESCYYYANGQKSAMDYLDLYYHMNQLTGATLYYGSSRCNEIESLIFSEQTEEVYNSDTYKAALEEYAANCSFLIGSLTQGYGLYMMKQTSNTFRMFYINGLFRRHEIIHVDPYEENLYYYYQRSWSSATYSIADLSSVFFFWDGDENSRLSMFSVPISSLNTSVRYTTGYNTPDYQGGFDYLGWNPCEIGGLADSMFCKWDSSLEFVSYPIYPFQISIGGVAFGGNCVTNWYDYSPPAGTDKLLGEDFSLLDNDDEDDSGSTGTDGGGGDYPTDSDDCKDPDASDLNTVNVINSGLVTLYNPTMGTLQGFSDFLFTGITDSIANQLKKLLSNPLDYVLFCALCKFSPTVDTAEEISFCGIGSGVSAPVIPNQFHTLDCGSIELPEESCTFMDYSPHSKIQLYLPYCGIHELNADDVKGGRVHIKYNIDMLSGCCVASVEVKRRSRNRTDATIDSSLYKFDGNCYLTMPLSATDWRGAYNSMVSFAGGIVATAAGNPMAGIGEFASAVTQQKVSVGRSGQAGSNYGHMSDGKPYFILSRPVPAVPYNFKGYEGYKSNIYYQVSQLIGHGYTEIDQNTLWSDNFGYATKEECDMIKEIMNGGVYL